MNTILRRSRGAVAAVLLLAASSVHGQSSGPNPAQRGSREPLKIISVTPSAAAPNDRVTIVLSGEAKVNVVAFGGVQARINSVAGNVVYVTVPELEPGETPPITVFAPMPVNYLGFKVTKVDHFDIKAEPARVMAGGNVTILLSRPLAPDVTVSLDNNLLDAKLDITRTRISVVIPLGTRVGKTVLTVMSTEEKGFVDIEILEPRILGIRRSWFYAALGTLLLASLGIGAMYIYIRVNQRRLERLQNQFETIRAFGTPPSEPEPPALPQNLEPIAVPEELVDIIASGSAVLFAGPGLAAQAGLPTRSEALVHLIEAADVEAIDDTLKNQLRDSLRAGQLGFVTEALDKRIKRDTIIALLRDLYADDDISQSKAHQLLQNVPFAGVLTTGWDGLIERTFEKRKPLVSSGEQDLEELNRSPEAFPIFRLFGDLYETETFVFTNDEYRRTLYDRPSYAKVVASQAFNRPILFIGMSLTGIQEFFDAFNFPVRFTGRAKSYAILPYTTLWEVQQDRFREKYGVELIGYSVTPKHTAVVDFLTKLEAEVRPRAQVVRGSQLSDAKLRRVALTNIGAFESLVLSDLQPGWNVLLGNNGTGKSTVLRAIALGLCGEAPEAALHAGKLLRRGASRGLISLQVGEITYDTELIREGTPPKDRVFVRSQLTTPLQNGSWVVLGFPPLRGVSSRDPSGPSSMGAGAPLVADLVPLIKGSIDTRLDSLKDWLVNLDVRSNMARSRPFADAQRHRRTIDAFFDLLRAFTPGQNIEEGKIEDNGTSWTVNVKTEDGQIPIDNVSQGMSSIFGWVGTLIQRMYEINANAEEPAKQPALVLVDEIDAHLHPEWQQKLTGIVREHFPNVQIIATTHSPLIVAGMKQRELLIASRAADKVTVTPAIIDPEGLRADQLLTSPIFGLTSTRSPEVAAKIERYTHLLGKMDRNATEETEFAELKKELSTRLVYGEREVDRVAERDAAAEHKKNIADLAAAVAKASQEMKDRLRQEL